MKELIVLIALLVASTSWAADYTVAVPAKLEPVLTAEALNAAAGPSDPADSGLGRVHATSTCRGPSGRTSVPQRAWPALDEDGLDTRLS